MVTLPGFVVWSLDTKYVLVMAFPPLAPFDQEIMSSLAVVDVADGFCGACGTVVIVTEAEAVESADVPAALVADTVKVYPVAESKPPTVIGELEPVVPVAVVSRVVPFL